MIDRTHTPALTQLADLEGQVAVVTGATRGIGHAVALELAKSGANIVAIARTASDLERTGDQVRDLGRELIGIAADVSAAESLPSVAAEAIGWTGAVDIVVNAAGRLSRQGIFATTPAEWDETFNVNVRAPFFLTQAFGEHMLTRGRGSVVNVTSMAGVVSSTGGPVSYCASKAALGHLTRMLASRWAPHVRVNAVAPGYVRTDLNAEWLDVPENLQFVVDHTLLQRLGAPTEIAAAVAYLASPAAAFVTGQEVLVDGGWSAK